MPFGALKPQGLLYGSFVVLILVAIPLMPFGALKLWDEFLQFPSASHNHVAIPLMPFGALKHLLLSTGTPGLTL